VTHGVGMPLAREFFERDTRVVARDLLGKTLESTVDGRRCSGRIVETEAYLGSDDPGSHAATKGMTRRNSVMYAAPATVYVYLTYGIHHMVNLVCEPEGVAGAVLIRAVEPMDGRRTMRARRGVDDDSSLCDGPAKLAQALGVDLSCNGAVLGRGSLVVYDAPVPEERVGISARIGLRAGHELDYRFYLSGNGSVSKGRPGASPPRKRTRAKDEGSAT
jgi:DNA-3-methyladenine glycosylase